MKTTFVLLLALLLAACGPSQDEIEQHIAQQRSDALDALESLNRSVVAADPILDGDTFHASVTNNLDVAISWIDFVYEVRTPGRALPWQEGDAAFRLDGGLEPGETRVLEAIPLGIRHRFTNFTLADAALKDHPDARITLIILDAKGADKNTLLPHSALFPNDERLAQLRQRLAKK